MYIATNEIINDKRGVLNILPGTLRRYMSNINLDEASEIRLICGKPLTVRYSDGDYYVTQKYVLSQNPIGTVTVLRSHINEIMERITKSSLYSVKEELRSGFITIEGGHRVGIAGTAITENGSVEFIKNISALNIRLANEVIGAADSVVEHIINKGIVRNTLIISPPGAGKTTLLRDIVRTLSYRRYSVAVADERCEIAAMHEGRSSFDLGGCTAVMESCPKDKGMLMLLRSMSPDVIVTDEIGNEEDAAAIRAIVNCGAAVIATAHGRNIKQAAMRSTIAGIMPLFDVIISLSKREGAGTVEEVHIND